MSYTKYDFRIGDRILCDGDDDYGTVTRIMRKNIEAQYPNDDTLYTIDPTIVVDRVAQGQPLPSANARKKRVAASKFIDTNDLATGELSMGVIVLAPDIARDHGLARGALWVIVGISGGAYRTYNIVTVNDDSFNDIIYDVNRGDLHTVKVTTTIDVEGLT